ncbi:MAG: amidase family protein [Mycobacteriaceae bacterium]
MESLSNSNIESSQLIFYDVVEQARMIAAKEISSVLLTQLTLKRIKQLNPKLNAFTCILEDSALMVAQELDDELQQTGKVRGLLHGVPIAIKDDNDVAGVVTTFGGRASTIPALCDGEVVRKLKEAGAIIIGKTNLPEFASLPFTEPILFGPALNPWNIERSSAGSSGGSAVAVASGMVGAAIGTDGGGSIRLPSAYCGLVGLKAQRGRVSSAPYQDLWRLLGTTGPLTRSVRDCALIYDVISGSTPIDRLTTDQLEGPLADMVDAKARSLRIAISQKNPARFSKPNSESLAALNNMAECLLRIGHKVEFVDPWYPGTSLELFVMFLSGVSDKVQFVDRPDLVEKRTQLMLRFASIVRGARIGRWVERKALSKSVAFNEFFKSYDLLVTPTVTSQAVPSGQTKRNILVLIKNMLTTISYTGIWNVLGNPAAAIPAGLSHSGLPLSVQLIGATNGEPTVIEVATQIERKLPWSEQWSLMDTLNRERLH